MATTAYGSSAMVPTALRPTLALGAVALAVVAAGCGTASPDLFIAQRTGAIPGAKLRLRVTDDGVVKCNGTPKQLPSKTLILARVLSRDLAEPAQQKVSLPPEPDSVLHYSFRVEDGVTSFSDNSLLQPAVFYRAALLVRQIAKGTCGLPR